MSNSRREFKYQAIESANLIILTSILGGINAFRELEGTAINFLQLFSILTVSFSLLDTYSLIIDIRKLFIYNNKGINKLTKKVKIPYYIIVVPIRFVIDAIEAIIVALCIASRKRLDLLSHISCVACFICLITAIYNQPKKNKCEFKIKDKNIEMIYKSEDCNNSIYQKDGKKYKLTIQEVK